MEIKSGIRGRLGSSIQMLLIHIWLLIWKYGQYDLWLVWPFPFSHISEHDICVYLSISKASSKLVGQYYIKMTSSKRDSFDRNHEPLVVTSDQGKI